MLSLQVDGCSKKHRHFSGVNAQYVKDGKTVVRTLAIQELHLQSTAEHLKDTILRILRKFDISVKNVISVTSDNGGNYLLAGKLLHLEDTEVIEDLRDIEPEGDDRLDVELSTDDEPIQSVRCAAHTLQLAVDEAMKRITDVKPTLDAARQLSRFLRTPSNVRQLEAAGKSLPLLDVATRWGSTYDMLKSVFTLRHFFDAVMDMTSKERDEHALTDEQWDVVEQLLADLLPVYTATVKLQARDLTLGQLLAIWTEATMALKSRRTDLSEAIILAMDEKAKSVMYKGRGRGERLSSLFEYPAFCASVFANPRFFSLLTKQQVTTGKEYLLKLWQRLQARRGIQEEQPEEDGANDVSSEEDFADEDPFAAFLAKKNQEKVAATRQPTRSRPSRGRQPASAPLQGREKVRAMLDEYFATTKPIPTKSDVLQFWEDKKLVWPELYEMAMIVLAIPATQVSVERLFSALRFILRPQRFKLAGDRVDDIVFLHANADLVREAVKKIVESVNDEETESEADVV
ncbi:hypothetical protein FOCC_FOCC012380 [Frankliniella occidentalis]|nr:hypothetical protein FOCC_FOCC012380 [Frankliniella occidentalis]